MSEKKIWKKNNQDEIYMCLGKKLFESHLGNAFHLIKKEKNFCMEYQIYDREKIVTFDEKYKIT